MSLASQVQALATRIGTEFKSVRAAIAALPAINDTTPSTTSLYSSSKVNSQVSAAVANLVNSAPTTLDTLGEIATQLASDESAASALAVQVANRVRVDAAQGLTAAQQQQARDNIATYSQSQIGDPTTDFVAVFVAALT